MTALPEELLGPALRPASALYGLAMSARNRLYDRGLLRAHRLAVPVVSIGNITVGGTGKTPLSIHLARLLMDAGEKPVVLSRGYGSQGTGTRIVSDGASVRLGVREAGDEPFLIARSVPGLPVVVDPDRVRGGRFAVERFSPTVVLLDDGYQHRRLARDLDIVLLDAVDPFGRYATLPSGRLREPFTGLARADLFVVTHAPDKEPLETLRALVRRFNPHAPILRARHRPESLVPLFPVAASGPAPLSAIAGAAVHAFCAIGNPEGFRASLAEAGARVTGLRVFRDHHPFSRDEVADIAGEARRAGAAAIVTTEKDAVRLDGTSGDLPLYALRIRMEIDPEAALRDRVLATARKAGA